MNRLLYIVAYDITEPSRITKTRNYIKGYSTGGQKSVFECFLTETEKNSLINGISQIMDLKSDRVHIFHIENADITKVEILGIAVKPADPSYLYFG